MAAIQHQRPVIGMECHAVAGKAQPALPPCLHARLPAPIQPGRPLCSVTQRVRVPPRTAHPLLHPWPYPESTLPPPTHLRTHTAAALRMRVLACRHTATHRTGPSITPHAACTPRPAAGPVPHACTPACLLPTSLPWPGLTLPPCLPPACPVSLLWCNMRVLNCCGEPQHTPCSHQYIHRTAAPAGPKEQRKTLDDAGWLAPSKLAIGLLPEPHSTRTHCTQRQAWTPLERPSEPGPTLPFLPLPSRIHHTTPRSREGPAGPVAASSLDQGPSSSGCHVAVPWRSGAQWRTQLVRCIKGRAP